MRCRIEKLVQGGDGLSTTDEGKRLFIPETLQGELVEARIVQQKAGYALGEVTSIIEASEERIHPPCPYWGICGGCDFQYAHSDAQGRIKEQIVLDNLVRLGSLDLETIGVEPVETGPAFGYRNRVRFHVDLGTRQVGFLGKKTNTLVPITSCMVLCDALNALLADPQPLFAAARKLMFANRKGKGGYLEVPVFASDSKLSFFGEEVVATVGHRQFIVSSEVFFQSNPYLLPSLGEYVAAHAFGDVVMDLYSGVGTFSAFLEQEGRHLIAVERQKQCLDMARRNVGNCEYYTQAVEEWAKGRSVQVDTVVVDPPRTGLDETLPSLIASWKPKRVIYVSCNSVTLGRDLQRFASEGYTVRKVKVFDLYPQTFHHEVVAILDRGGFEV
nr:TRAM domain-containing protein [uncultured Sphaerochaeta sp.]